MAFGRKVIGPVKNQNEIVAELTKAKNRIEEDMVAFPGVKEILNMSELELISFFQLVLKSRPNVIGLKLVLGSYNYREEMSRVPGSDKIHTFTKENAAKTIVNVLTSNPNIVGFDLQVSGMPGGQGQTTFKIFLADKEAVGPTFNEDGDKVEGDPEFDPQIKITYVPVA